MRITRIQAESFDPGMELTRFTRDASQAGAIVSFTGRVRPHGHQGQPLTAMTLEHYPGMTETQIAQIAEEATQRWPLERLLVLHRFGRLLPSEPIVFVSAAAAHRRPAFEAADFLMDWLKTKAPFWKLEESLGGEAWVASKEEDAQAAGRWGSLSSPHTINLKHLPENHRRFSGKCSKVARFDSGAGS